MQPHPKKIRDFKFFGDAGNLGTTRFPKLVGFQLLIDHQFRSNFKNQFLKVTDHWLVEKLSR